MDSNTAVSRWPREREKEIARLAQRKEVILNNDYLTYQTEIEEVLNAAGEPPSKQRLLLGKAFIHAIKKEMGSWLLQAGIFGSASRNEAKSTSDVDIVLFIKPLTSEEKKLQNTRELVQGRGGVYNFANNSYRITELVRSFSKKTGIEIHCDMWYEEKYLDEIKEKLKPIMILE